MTKTAYNFRLTPDTLRQLDQLAQVYTEGNRTQMLTELIRAAAYASGFAPPLPAPVDGAALVEYLKAAPGHPARGR